MPEIAYINGTFLPIADAMIPVEDRGYQFADAVYEAIASYNGRPFCLDDHLERLDRSMKALSFPSVSLEKIRHTVLDMLQRSKIARALIYIQISRGVAPRIHACPDTNDLQVVMTARPVQERSRELRSNGAAAISVEDFRWKRCDIKTVQLLANVMAKQQALDAGADDAIFISGNSVVREATSSNVFIVADGHLVTHPATRRILSGITRNVIVDICAEQQVPVTERYFNIDELYAADEVFLTGTSTEVLPVVRVDNRIIGDGRIGPVSRQCFEALHDRIRQQTAA